MGTIIVGISIFIDVISYQTMISRKAIYILVVLVLLSDFLFSQEVVKDTFINEPFKLAWAGGIDAVQYGSLDFNMDGIMDLLVFDRRGNRKMCFVNSGISNTIDYSYDPKYSDLLPEFSDWVIFTDYNMDGLNDIFTYSPGYAGIIVYKNVSDNVLKFERVVYPYLKTLFPGGYVNLFVTNADYPGIADVDNDGDLDILTFGVLGSFVDMHKNMSIEKYGIPDSLDFEHYTYCWGRFAENDESNQLFLDTCFGDGFKTQNKINERHTGSTMLLHDLDNNGLIDMLLGDVDYPQIYALYNNGSPENALITKVDTLFPAIDRVDLFSMPLAAYIDVNNDDIKDLLVSPFDPGIITSRNDITSWLYLNTGTDNNPEFELITKKFLQGEMIDVGSGAYPVVFDWDNDGLKDIFMGNFGYYQYSYYDNYFLNSVYYSQIAFFKNIGSADSPKFQLWNRDFANLSSLKDRGLIPAFIDIDKDGFTDLLVGNENGTLYYIRNNGNSSFEVVTDKYLDIDVGEFSAPTLFDLNNDGLLDLTIGEKSGNLNLWLNTDNGSSVDFEFMTDSLGKVNVTDYSLSWDGYSVPSFFKDENDNTMLIVGSEQGKLFHYSNIDNNLVGKFTLADDLNTVLDTSNVNYDRGLRTAAVITSFYSNNKLQMLAGNYSGGLELFNGTADVNSYIKFTESQGLIVFPNPANRHINIEIPTGIVAQQIEVYNSLGQIVYKHTNDAIETNIVLNITHLKNGLHILKIKTVKSSHSAIFVKTD